MNLQQLFFQRYDVLYSFWLEVLWTDVPPELMRQRPHQRLNSIAWILWHLTRVEDAGLSRFVVDRPQVFDEGAWMQRLNVPLRHHGSGMTLAEVDELSQRIDLAALRAYSQAVEARTREILATLRPESLDETMDAGRLRLLLVDEGLAYSDPEGLLQNYLGWSKGKCLMNFGLTHSFQHVGEMDVIATLLGVEFD
jgi:uncharacterized damage-inducible protein DinB